jgi:hypothetical protein
LEETASEPRRNFAPVKNEADVPANGRISDKAQRDYAFDALPRHAEHQVYTPSDQTLDKDIGAVAGYGSSRALQAWAEVTGAVTTA